MWKAYVNLECIYGSSETLMAVTKRALSAVTNQRDVYLHLVEMYHSGGKHEGRTALLSRQCEGKILRAVFII